MKMSNFNYNLREVLLNNIPGAKSASGNKEVVCRCNICMDSKDINKKHMYISIGNDNTPPMYHCFLCGSSGLVNGKFLRSYGIFDPQIINETNNNVQSITSKPSCKIHNSSNEKVFMNTFCNFADSDLSIVKLQYINNRLGLSLNYNDISKLKIILNLSDFLNINNVTEYTRHMNIMEDLNYNFIGFLSEDNCFINMRNIINNNSIIKTRYMNYNIFNKIDNSSRYYIIPTNIDLNYCSQNIQVHIAEGPFDILSILFNVVGNTNNNIFMSVGGRGYLLGIKYILQSIGLINIDFNIYADNDVDNYEIKNIIDYLHPFRNINIRLYRNIFPDQKDFGVSKNLIKISQIY